MKLTLFYLLFALRNIRTEKIDLGDSVLSLIFLDYIEKSYLEDVVKPSLINLHLKDVVFVTNSSLSSLDEWIWLFSWCWLEGFWHMAML